MSQDLAEMREQVFREYRQALIAEKQYESNFEALQHQMRDLQAARAKAHNDTHRLRTLIDIMISEDCDPVMAKLKYAELSQFDDKCSLDAGPSKIYVGTNSISNPTPSTGGIVNRIRRALNV